MKMKIRYPCFQLCRHTIKLQRALTNWSSLNIVITLLQVMPSSDNVQN